MPKYRIVLLATILAACLTCVTFAGDLSPIPYDKCGKTFDRLYDHDVFQEELNREIEDDHDSLFREATHVLGFDLFEKAVVQYGDAAFIEYFKAIRTLNVNRKGRTIDNAVVVRFLTQKMIDNSWSPDYLLRLLAGSSSSQSKSRILREKEFTDLLKAQARPSELIFQSGSWSKSIYETRTQKRDGTDVKVILTERALNHILTKHTPEFFSLADANLSKEIGFWPIDFSREALQLAIDLGAFIYSDRILDANEGREKRKQILQFSYQVKGVKWIYRFSTFSSKFKNRAWILSIYPVNGPGQFYISGEEVKKTQKDLKDDPDNAYRFAVSPLIP